MNYFHGHMEGILKNFSDLLRQWRKDNGLKQSAAAKELGVSTATWGHWEEKIRFPTVGNLIALSRYTKIPVALFICPDGHHCPLSGLTKSKKTT